MRTVRPVQRASNDATAIIIAAFLLTLTCETGLGQPCGEWRGAASGPTGREYHAMAYDSARGVTVLFGGRRLGSTWEWQYNVWIAGHPHDVITIRGERAEFSVVVEGSGLPTYQWRRNGMPLQDGGTISGSRTDTLTISRVFRADAGEYDCVVTGDCGEITSRGAMLYVVDPALQVSPTCPGGGPMAVSWQYAAPGGQVALIFARNTGRYTVPQNYPCAGTRLGLGSNQIQLAWQGAAGTDGSRTINGSAGPGACGGFMQLLDLDTCTTSNVVRVE